MQLFPGVIESAPGKFETESAQDEGLALSLLGSGMGALGVLAFGGATVVILASNPVLAVVSVPPTLLAAAFFGFFARELWWRLTRMGRFVLDASSGMLFRDGSGQGRRVVRIHPSTRMGGSFARGGTASWWLLAEVDGGPTYRIAKGTWEEVRGLLGRLRALGFSVEGHDELVLLRTRRYAVAKLSDTRYEFRATEGFAKVVGVLVVTVWLGIAGTFAAGFVYAFVARAWSAMACTRA